MTWDAIHPQLRADWIRLGNIVRHEWQRAAGPDGDAPPEPSAAATL